MRTRLLVLFLLFSAAVVEAQGQNSIPLVVKFTGSLRGLQGQSTPAPVGVTFALYKDQAGGAPLWIETQNVLLDSQGRFTVLLGASSGKGIPPNIFASGEARWLGMTPDDGVERARAMLASVPYAFKAGDAQTIAGRAPEEFVTQAQLSSYLSAPSHVAPVEPIIPGITVVPGNSPLMVGGGSGSGSVFQKPSGNHVFAQRPGTSAKASRPMSMRVVQAGDSWTVGNIPTTLTAGIQATVTLTPCPLGVDTSDSPILGGPNGGYPVYINDAAQPTNSEPVYVTGGSCTSAATSGTIIFTPYFSHAMSTYAIGSASSGIQEAINDSCGTSTWYWDNGYCQVEIPGTGPLLGGYSGYDVYDTIYFHANESVLTGYGAILNCHGRGPCLQVGDLSNSNHNVDNTIQGISFRSPDNRSSDPAFYGSLIQSTQRTGGTITIQTAASHNFRTGDRVTQMLTDTSNYWGDVPSITVSDATHYTYPRANTADLPLQTTPGVVALSYEAVLDNGGSTSLIDLVYENTSERGVFNHFFDIWDDENALIEGFNNNAISLNQNANWTGSFVWSGGALTLPNTSQQLAPVITVDNSSITANGSNCATVYNSNQFSFQNSVCQAQGPWEFLISTINGNYQGAAFQNVYSEASLVTNPASPARSPWPGLGVAGLIGGPTSGAGSYTLSGQGGFSGALPTIGSGSTTYVYYVVGRNLTRGTQTSPLPFMYEKENSPSQITVPWPRLASGTDTVVYDLIRNPDPAGGMNAAGGGYVAPYPGGCNGGGASACGSVALGLAQCSGLVCSFVDNTANATAAYSIRDGNFIPNPTFWPGTAVLSSTPLQSAGGELQVTGIAFNGAPTLYANYCSDYGDNVSGGYTVCTDSITTPNNSVADQAPLMLTDGPAAGGGGVAGAKGRLIFETTATSNAASHQVITIYDSNPGKTQATTGHRPVGDPGDMYLGIDPNKYLMIGGGANGIATYVNNIGDGTNILELLTPSLKTFQVPVTAPSINVTTGIQVNGSYGSPGQCLISTGTGAKWGHCLYSFWYPPRWPALPMFPANTSPEGHSGGKANQCEGGGDCNGAAKATFDGTQRGKITTSVSFSAIPSGTCADRTFRWNGLSTSESLVAGWPKNLHSGMIGNLYVSAADTVTVRLCNFSGAAVAPGDLALSATLGVYSLSGSGSLSFAALQNGTCAAQAFPLTGVSAGDPVTPKWPSTLEAGLLGEIRASADNTIEVRLCNFSGKALTPASQIFGAFIAH